ncbi:glycosyltransferase [Waterburya agarophytonicola K14]|uniref:Glycosyltransferase n=1 Tax=Waterburya agarophytonicola KI4 TaxID=2874699 RepID=A0A964BPD5_9CYAN|nr:glycosyltransferase [Waterburya agarophytonicola]MCC0176814.1 glycosyltransferase [Waterburya agarophytonicola KI4]
MSIESPTVSVIILTNRGNRLLLETINSVRQQTYQDFEILVCHNGNALNLLEWYKRQQDLWGKLFLQEDLDPIQRLNLSIEQARGKYIALLKADNLWHPCKLEKQVFYLDNYASLGLIHSWLTLVDDRHKPLGIIVKNQISGWVESAILERNQINYSSAMIRRVCFEKVGLFDSQLATSFDWDMWIRLSRCYQFMTIAETLVYCHQPQDTLRESWLTREIDLQATIEKAYQNASIELRHLKNRSYAYASLSLAWQVLHHQDPKTAIADHYCRQALEYSPRISFSPEFLRVSLAVMTLHYLKSDRYICLLSLIQTIRAWLQAVKEKFKVSAHRLLHWMLQENEIGKEKVMRKDEGTG